ncbi:MAG: NAD(P)-binding domain-containing protein [Betaproteobacteria bacterium]
MNRIDTLVIGGGQAGLAMSRCLSDRAVDHVVLERGRVAERWRSERWDSLRLLTPNWQTRLPAFRYEGPHPDGYMSMPQLVAFFERYAASFAAPVELAATVLRVERAGAEFLVQTSRGAWLARNVVIGTGYSDLPYVPPLARTLSPRIVQIVPTRYRNPDQLPPGGVLVVGASATGVQLAAEIRASGRPVTLAVGRHLRLPRTYRGRDIMWWLDAMGVFDDTAGDVFDIHTSRSRPSLQLVGRPDAGSLNLTILQRRGVHVFGRLVGADSERVFFDDDLIATTAASDVKLAELLSRIDAFISKTASGATGPPEPFEPTWPSAFGVTKTTIDLREAGIDTVIWATGFTRRYPWLRVPVLDERGEIVQRGGVTPVEGLFVLGMHFQRRRKSAFIDGVGDDAAFLADRIVGRAPSGQEAARGTRKKKM